MARKKPKRRKKKRQEQIAPEDSIAPPDRLFMERAMADITKLLEEQQFETAEEMDAFLKGLMAGGPIPSFEPETPLDRAQEVMYEAWESSGKKRVRLARKALRISPDCADAYVLLAEEEARTPEEARNLYEKGVQAGERAIGEELLQTGEGHFWGILETRPYMRARSGLAHVLWYMGERGEAIGHLQEMLRLNPGDNQGHRYTLNNWLLLEGREQELAKLLNQYDDDAAANWAYTRALLAFRSEGDSAVARRDLQDAVRANPHVPAYLLGSRPLPEHLPNYIGIGDENEAVDYAFTALPVWTETPGALAWLVMNRGKRDIDLPGAGLIGDRAREVPFKIGDPVAVKADRWLETVDLDISGWQGWIEEIDDDGDLWVRWDSQSLEAIPDDAFRQLHEEVPDWTVLIVEPHDVEAARPRDEPEDWLAVVTKRYEALGLDIDELVLGPVSGWFDAFDDDDLGAAGSFGQPDYPQFDLENFLAEEEIRKSDHSAIRGALRAGLGKYYHDIYGYYEHGKRPTHIEIMGVPRILGYGAIEVLDRKSISAGSKMKLVHYTLAVMEPGLEQGVPYGMISILGFAASEGALGDEEFISGMLGLQLSAAWSFMRLDWMEAATRDRLIALADWLGSHERMPDEEKLWWIWQLGRHCENQAHLGKALLDYWLGRSDVTAESKAELCWGWLDDERGAGEPPLIWLLSEAFLAGDREQFQQLIKDVDIDPEALPLLFDDVEEPVEDGLGFPSGAISRLRHFTFMPPSLKRGAIPGLVRYSDEGFEEIAERFWDSWGSYYIDALNSGIADALEEFHESIPPERMRFWVERGINYGRAQTRKRFYALSIEFYGTEYLQEATNDNAKSVRTWAAKKLRAMGGG